MIYNNYIAPLYLQFTVSMMRIYACLHRLSLFSAWISDVDPVCSTVKRVSAVISQCISYLLTRGASYSLNASNGGNQSEREGDRVTGSPWTIMLKCVNLQVRCPHSSFTDPHMSVSSGLYVSCICFSTRLTWLGHMHMASSLHREVHIYLTHLIYTVVRQQDDLM